MKLYELRRDDRFRLAEPPIIPPGAYDPPLGENVYTFIKVDGMYSLCYLDGQVCHIAAFSDVIKV